MIKLLVKKYVLMQVSNKGFSEFAGLRSSSLPFARKASDDLLSVVAFQTSVVSEES